MFSKSIVYVAMILLTVVSMWTTYTSLHDSILPEPVYPIPLGQGVIWECSIFALFLSVAIGLMLFALKIAIIDGEKRLNVLGILGLTVVAFISISFNMDVLYRTADRDFFLSYSISKMKAPYEVFLAEAEQKLISERDAARKSVAKQQGELESEIEGLRAAPQGYGRMAKEEDYKLRLLEKTTTVELDSIEEALAAVKSAETVMLASAPTTIEEVTASQNAIRIAIKDVAAFAGLPMPSVVKLENPLFVVFGKLFDFPNVGIKEIFFVIIAFFLDLGDIIGYSLIPNKKKVLSGRDAPGRRRKRELRPLPASPAFAAPVEAKQIEQYPEEEAEEYEDDPYDPFASPKVEINESHPPRRHRKSANFRGR